MEFKIGLEIHCQLTGLKSKLFCPCACNYRGKEPNTNTCPVCLGLPGTLPVLNKRAVEFAGIISLALGCSIPDETMFYRKNYFYPDLPKNFQLTQYNAYGITSIGFNGKLSYGGKSARIRRIQLEEDPGRLVYEAGSMEKSLYTLVDYNRAGVPLVEIVTEPDFFDPKDVRDFLNKVTSIVEHLGICDTNLEGAVRCDANVSVAGGNRVEIKNVSSFADVEKALKYEMTRQKTMVSRDMDVKAETRHWDDARKVTRESRSKEKEQDYRYFPEPDVPSIELGGIFVNSLQKLMPELPDTRKTRFESIGITPHVASVLIDNKELADFFESAILIHNSPKEIANWIVTDLMGFADEKEKEAGRSILSGIKAEPKHIADLAKLVEESKINRATAKQILAQVVDTGEMPSEIIGKSQVAKIDDASELAKVVDDVFSAEPSAVADARKNPAAANFLLGKVMQQTKGRADPKSTLELIQKKLKF